MAGQVTGNKGLTIEVVNLEKIVMAFGALGDQIASAAEVAALEEAKYVFPITQRRVPMATGQLQASGRVEGASHSTDEITIGIAYGGPAGAGDNTEDVDYALIVHEDLDAHHGLHESDFNITEGGKSLVITRNAGGMGRTAKYVEAPVREELESGRSAARMGAIIRARMGWT